MNQSAVIRFVFFTLVGSACAVQITDVSRSRFIFFNDGFEQDAVGSRPTYADPGTFTMSATRDLVCGPDSGGPGAYSGDQYLYTFRDATAGGIARFYFGNITDDGITVRYEWAWYLPTGADASVRLQGVSASDKSLWRFNNGNVQAHVESYQTRGTYTRDEWLVCSIEYTTGTEFATLTLNDVDIQMEVYSTVTGLKGISFQHASTGGYYLDAIPEPSTPLWPEPPLRKLLDIVWNIGPDMPQHFQDGGAGIVTNGAGDRILISACGFTVDGQFLNKVYGLNLDRRAEGWTELPDYPGSPRQGLVSAVAGNRLYLWGGVNYTFPYTKKDGYRLSLINGEWVWDSLPDLPTGSGKAACVTVGSKMYVMGGAQLLRNDDPEILPGFYTVIEHGESDPDAGARLFMIDTASLEAGWQRMEDCPGTPRVSHAMAAIDGNLYVLGGAARLVGGPMHTVVDNWKYDIGSGEWARLEDLPVSSGNFHGNPLVFHNRYIVLPGGMAYGRVLNNRKSAAQYGVPSKSEQPSPLGDQFYADVFVYDVRTGLFGCGDLLPLNNNLPVGAVSGNELFLMGGETGGARLMDRPTGAGYHPDGQYYPHRPNLCLIGTVQRAVPNEIPGPGQVPQVKNPDFDEPLIVPGEYSFYVERFSAPGGWRNYGYRNHERVFGVWRGAGNESWESQEDDPASYQRASRYQRLYIDNRPLFSPDTRSPVSGGPYVTIYQERHTEGFQNDAYQVLNAVFRNGATYRLEADLAKFSPEWFISLVGAESGIPVAFMSHHQLTLTQSWTTVAATGTAGLNVAGERIVIFIGGSSSDRLIFDSVRLSSTAGSVLFSIQTRPAE